MFDAIISRLPGIDDPKAHLTFKSRLKWTAIILLIYLVLGQITLYGVAPAERERFQFLELIFGASIGTLITLGIGPIVTASIILQLLVGSGLLNWDTKSPEGRKKFQGTQKLMVIFFCIFEAYAYVAFGAIKPMNTEAATYIMLMAQLAFGGFVVLLMDEVISKWGIGSGVSLFIAAGVSKGIFVQAFNPLTPPQETVPSGIIPQFIVLMGLGEISQAVFKLLPLIATILVFLIVVYVQALNVEIPLAFGSVRGFSRRWPLKLIYTSNIPVILVAALLANVQLVGNMVAAPTEEGNRCGFMGCYDSNGIPVSGVAFYLIAPNVPSIQVFFLVFLGVAFIGTFAAFYFRYKNMMQGFALSLIAALVLSIIITNSTVGLPDLATSLRSLAYLLILITGSIIFSIFWISTSGMDAKSVAAQIEGMGFQVPGFRRDPRIVEQVLNRYIPTLAIISGLLIGMIAALADFTGALGTGTGILLTVMIIYGLYEQISMQYMEDMHPSLRKFFK